MATRKKVKKKRVQKKRAKKAATPVDRQPSGRLRAEHRIFIVERLACYAGLKETSDELKAKFGVEITPQSIEAYDPTKYAGKELDKKLVTLFRTIRKDFLENAKDYIPIANKTVRLQKIQNHVDHFERVGNALAALEAIAQAAKESGGMFTNRREVSGPDGDPIRTESSVTTLPLEQAEAQLHSLGWYRRDDGGA